KELSIFLLKRGLWLVFLELIVVNFGWNFNPAFPMFFFITIWALGISMIILAGVIHLPLKAILAISIIIIAGHNLFDGVHVAGTSPLAVGWALLHDQEPFFWHHETFLIGYPLVPLIAIMPLGYCAGQLFTPAYSPEKRVKT